MDATEQDRIEREISIDAPPDRVWAMVSEPGWWIGDGDRSRQSRSRDGDLHVIDDPKYGRFPIRVEEVREPDYIAYRWLPEPGTAEAREGSTLVEFWVTPRDGGTVVRVVESGFAGLAIDERERQRRIGDNLEGWVFQLDVLRRDCTAAAG